MILLFFPEMDWSSSLMFYCWSIMRTENILVEYDVERGVGSEQTCLTMVVVVAVELA
jgi:hypothetical protein